MAVRVSTDVVEVFVALDTTAVRVSQDVVEAFFPSIVRSPTTITGVGISQDVVEVFVALTTTAVRVSQDVVEVFVSDTTQSGGGAGAGPSVGTSYGYAT